MRIKSSASLCEKCKHNDWEHMADIKAVYRMAAIPEPNHIWCKITDRPEDVRWVGCVNYGALRYGSN